MWSERRSVEYLTTLVRNIDDRTTGIATQFGRFDEAIDTLKLRDDELHSELQKLDINQDELALCIAHGKGFFTGVAIVVPLTVSLLVSIYINGG